MDEPGSLRGCDHLDNCVSTQDPPEDARHHMEPLKYDGDEAAAKARLNKIIAEMPRTKLVEEDGNYLHFTFATAIFRFTDDVEFLFEPDAKQIHFRSASRIGNGDLGVNRKRMTAIRKAWEG